MMSLTPERSKIQLVEFANSVKVSGYRGLPRPAFNTTYDNDHDFISTLI